MPYDVEEEVKPKNCLDTVFGLVERQQEIILHTYPSIIYRVTISVQIVCIIECLLSPQCVY